MAKKDAAPAPKASGDKNSQGPHFPLFYKKPAPLDRQKHAKLSLRRNFGLDFTRGINAVPINAIEMAQIGMFYPIAFSPDDSATPVAVLGLRDNENLFINADGQWYPDAYIPAYIRRYPFIFSEIPGGEQLSLCIDMDPAIVQEGGDQPFFDAKGEPTTLAKSALEFCKSYHAAARHTLEFSKALAASGLLVQREARINVGEKTKISFSGFRIVDEKKFAELPDQTFLEWRQKGWLPFIYAHLFSAAQWNRLTRLLSEKMGAEAA